MNRKIFTAVLAVLAVVLVAAAVLIWSGAFAGQPESPQAQLTPAPDFTVTTLDGQNVKLSDFKGKPVVLNFWASWCDPCKSEMPAFQAAYWEKGSQVQFMMVNLTGSSETVEAASGFIADEGYTFPVFYDTAGEGSAAYQVMSIPATYFIDSDGNIVASHVGAMNSATLETYLAKILN